MIVTRIIAAQNCFSMKTLKLAIAIAIGLAAITAAADYSLSWWKIAGGGGSTASPGYSLDCTIGQFEAGAMSSSEFDLVGGFWAIITAQVTNTPVPGLTITASGPNQAVLSWTPDVPGFHLQTSDSLSPSFWTDAASGTNHPITISTTGPMKFYRLVNP